MIPDWILRLFLASALIVYGGLGVIAGVGCFPHFTDRKTPPIVFTIKATPGEARVLGAIWVFLGTRSLWRLRRVAHRHRGKGMAGKNHKRRKKMRKRFRKG